MTLVEPLPLIKIPEFISPPEITTFCVTSPEIQREFQRARNAFAKAQWKKAIAGFTKVIQLNPDDCGEPLLGRAQAYERVGDKKSAIVDFRNLLDSSNKNTKDIARQRLAILAPNEASAQTTASVPKPAVTSPSAPSMNLQPVPAPPTSAIEGGRRRNAIAPLALEGEAGTNFLIKFTSANNDHDSILIFLKGGEKYSTKIPLGTYSIRVASGTIWYGRKEFFGPTTHFFRLRNKEGKQQTFVFHRQGRTIHGMTISFRKAVEGNMEEETISQSDF